MDLNVVYNKHQQKEKEKNVYVIKDKEMTYKSFLIKGNKEIGQ